MKRNNLTTALLAGIAGAAGLASTAGAVSLNPDGLGQVLIYPYYSVNGGNQTLVSVVNTTSQVKAVKVRFLEGRNSKEVLDFNLYLSPFDVWTGSVFSLDGASGTGAAHLVTTDTSCTVPILRNLPQAVTLASGAKAVPFLNYEYASAASGRRDHPASLAASLSALSRTREGHIEMIEMGNLVAGTASSQLADEATHINGTPANCQRLENAWNGSLPGVWTQAPLFGTNNITVPTGGLFGAGEVIDVANGTNLSYNAEAVEGFYTNAAAPGVLHAAPGTTDPDLRDYSTDGIIASTFVFSTNPATGAVSVITENFPVNPIVPNAVSLLFMHDSIMNEYVTEPALGAQSEWVVTFPTKRYYVDVATAAAVIDPFTNPFRDNGSSCEEISISYWDREERVPGFIPGGVIVSPPPDVDDPDVLALCWEANVISFNNTAVANGGETPILGGRYGFNLDTSDGVGGGNFKNGWARIDLDTLVAPDRTIVGPTTANDYRGLPVVGFWAANYVNSAAAPGLLANFSAAHRHRGSREIQ